MSRGGRPSKTPLRPALAAAVLAATLLAGCSGGGDVARPDAGDFGEDAVHLAGLVVDLEQVPVEGAHVEAVPGGATAVTGPGGSFQIGPLPPDEYVLTATKEGYHDAQATLQVGPADTGNVILELRPAVSTVPYHETWIYATFVNCWNSNIVGNVPCTKLPDYVLGTNVSADERFAFSFKVPYEGLADILTETDWETQPLGRDMVFQVLTPPNQPVNALIERYFSVSGGPVLRGWIVNGEVNDGGDVAFDGEADKIEYEARIIPANSNQTVPFHGLYLNHRTDSYMTFFYNREGPRDYSAAPDR